MNLTPAKETIKKATKWTSTHVVDYVENLLRDLKSLRALWNWIYLALYTWICIWLVLYYAKECGTTVVVTTGSIVSFIFGAYVTSTYLEKKNNIQPQIPSPTKRDDIEGSD